MMTNEEAIKTIEVIKGEAEWEYPLDWQLALDVAIEALNSVMDTENDTVKTENDVIKRQDAIEAVCRTRCRDKAKGCPAHSCPVIEEFDALPSTEPNLQPTCNQLATTKGDLISRQAAIDALGEEPEIWNDSEEEWAYRNAWVEHISTIKSLPSAEPKTGKWVKVIDEETPNVTIWHYECDQCGQPHDRSKYCPNCGARMRPKLQGTHFDSIIVDECAMKGADDE